jgi:uracil-DNA glycosylase family 4
VSSRRPTDAHRLRELERQVPDCRRCPRLARHLAELRQAHPDYWNRPVPGFGDPRAWLVIVGLAPGLHGANRSGRPFWLDASGEWLYGILEKRGAWDGEQLRGVHITNAVKCVPPANRPTTAELDRCRYWLARELEALSSARVVLTLGALAHRSLLGAWGVRPLSSAPFRHGSVYELPDRPVLLASYHPSRQNTNTGVLTRAMWTAIFRRAERLAREECCDVRSSSRSRTGTRGRPQSPSRRKASRPRARRPER